MDNLAMAQLLFGNIDKTPADYEAMYPSRNLAEGAKVTKDDLERYGRTDVTFTKIEDELFYMDFSV